MINETIHEASRAPGAATTRSGPEQRHAARAARTYRAFLARLRAKGFASNAEGEQAAISVLHALEQRLNEDECFNLESQLPSLLADLLVKPGWRADLRPRDIGKHEFLQLVNDHFSAVNIDAEQAVRWVFEAIAEQVTAGETHKIIHRLPRDLRELWPEWARAAEERVVPSNPAQLEPQLQRAPDVVDDVFALSMTAQLGVLRTIAPKILARLDEEERRGFLRDLDTEIYLALTGAPTYDLRHSRDR
jgi:uncharacterized protein (DUF2267 family)